VCEIAHAFAHFFAHAFAHFAKTVPVYLSGSRVPEILLRVGSSPGRFRLRQLEKVPASATRRTPDSRLGVHVSLCVAADEGAKFLNQRWFTVSCNAVGSCSLLLSCSTGSGLSRPRTLNCAPLPKQAGNVRPFRLLWLTAHAVEVGHCSSPLHKCSSCSSLLQTSRACLCDPFSSAAYGSVDFSPLTGRTQTGTIVWLVASLCYTRTRPCVPQGPCAYASVLVRTMCLA